MPETGFSVPHPAQLRRFGRVFYPAGLRLQKALADYVDEEGRPDQLVLLEHDPVFTLGRNATPADIHMSEDFLAAQGVSVHRTDRGGEVTYHGPGQIVAYPICNLRGGREDVGRLVRGLEEAMIRTAADFGVVADRLEGRARDLGRHASRTREARRHRPPPQPLDQHPRHRLQRAAQPGPLPLDHALRLHRQGRLQPGFPPGRWGADLGGSRRPPPGPPPRAAGPGPAALSGAQPQRVGPHLAPGRERSRES